MTTVAKLKWRYATKRFDRTKKLTDDQLDYLKEAIRLTPSSYGLQPYKVLIFENQALKDRLFEATHHQSQITEASHIFVFCAFNQVTDLDIENHIKRSAKVNGIEPISLKGFEDAVKSKVAKLPSEQTTIWTAKQAYIAMSNMLLACADLEIDSCPIEGFKPEQYTEILQLDGITPVVLVAVGYRSEEDHNQHRKQSRKSQEDLFQLI